MGTRDSFKGQELSVGCARLSGPLIREWKVRPPTRSREGYNMSLPLHLLVTSFTEVSVRSLQPFQSISLNADAISLSVRRVSTSLS